MAFTMMVDNYSTHARWTEIYKREWTNCFIKNNHEILLELPDFALQKQPEENLIIAISWARYNGSNATAAEPTKLNPWNCIIQ